MSDDWEPALTRVRVDTGAFARDVQSLRDTLDGSLGEGADRAGRSIETALARAVRTGKLGFDDLKGVAMRALGDIAAAALKAGIGAALGGGGGARGGGGGVARVLVGVFGGAPGRATGGPVGPGRAYMVGERGPGLFVPTQRGRVEAGAAAAGPREVRVAITVNAPAGAAPGAMAQSSRQVARAVRAALVEG